MSSPETTTTMPRTEGRKMPLYSIGELRYRESRGESTAMPGSAEHVGEGLFGSIEDLRQKQHDKLTELRANAGTDIRDTTYVDTFIKGVDDQVTEHLEKLGLTPETPGYDEVWQLSRDGSIDKISDDAWNTQRTNADGTTGLSGREMMKRRAVDLVATERSKPEATAPTTPEPAPTTPEAAATPRPEHPKLIDAREKNPELKAAIEELNELRAKLAKLAAKQLGKPIALTGKYNNARSEYNDALQYVGKFEEKIRVAAMPDRSDQDKNVDFVQYIMAEQTKLRDLTREAFANTKVSKFIEWFNRGGRVKRILKGVAVGAIVAVPGALIAPVGIAGAGALVAGGAVATRFTRNYARHDTERGVSSAEEGINQDEFIQHLETEGGTVENAVAYVDKKFDDERKTQQRRRLGAAAWGLTGVVIGAAAGEAVHLAGDINWSSVKDHISVDGNHADGTSDHGHPGVGSNEPGANDHNLSQHEQHVQHQHHVDHQDHIDHQNHIDHTGTTNEKSLDWSDFGVDAHAVHAGEGWNQTMRELGIPQRYWPETLQNAGPKLHEQGWAYFDKPHNEWRISHAGKLPVSVLKTIAASSRRGGFTLAS